MRAMDAVDAADAADCGCVTAGVLVAVGITLQKQLLWLRARRRQRCAHLSWIWEAALADVNAADGGASVLRVLAVTWAVLR